MLADTKKYILLIDDDKDLLKLLELKLLRDGYDVKTLLNGANLLDAVAEKKPDLVLIDVNMPHVSGNALCKVIKQNASTETIPVILFSGNENVEKITRACGADGYISKPCDPSTLSKQIDRFLQNKKQDLPA
jgi:DNA-binding response OmpR family regulator